MRPNRSTAVVVELFQKWWQGGCLPREAICEELRRHGTPLPLRTMDYALAQAIRRRDLARITSYDGGALYCLRAFADDSPGLVAMIRQEPHRSMNSKDKARRERAIQRMQSDSARRGAHDLRPGHKCVPCGYRPHRNPD